MNRPADNPLANRTRAAIVERLRSDGHASLDELAESAGVHRNTARAHVEALEAAGLIDRTTQTDHERVGRPRTLYRLTAAAQVVEPQPIAELLGAALAESRLSRPQAERLGRLRAATAKRVRSRRRGVAQQLEQELADLGFRARVYDEAVELDHCPCPLVAAGNPALVCSLVAGTVDGALERMGAAGRVMAASHDPDTRRCTLVLGS